MKEPTRFDAHSRLRLELGLDILETWADTAPLSRKNAVYKALLAVVDRSAFRTYRIIDDYQRPDEVFVIVRDDLMLKLRINGADSFGLLYIGPCGGAAGEPHRRT